MFALGAACHLVLLLPCVKKKGQEIASNEIVLVEEEDKTMLPSSNDEEVWLRESFCCFDMYGFILVCMKWICKWISPIWLQWFILCKECIFDQKLLSDICLRSEGSWNTLNWLGLKTRYCKYVNVLITTSVNCYNYLTVCLNGIFLEWSVTGLHDCSKFDLELYKFVDPNNFNLGKQLLRMW